MEERRHDNLPYGVGDDSSGNDSSDENSELVYDEEIDCKNSKGSKHQKRDLLARQRSRALSTFHLKITTLFFPLENSKIKCLEQPLFAIYGHFCNSWFPDTYVPPTGHTYDVAEIVTDRYKTEYVNNIANKIEKMLNAIQAFERQENTKNKKIAEAAIADFYKAFGIPDPKLGALLAAVASTIVALGLSAPATIVLGAAVVGAAVGYGIEYGRKHCFFKNILPLATSSKQAAKECLKASPSLDL
jgi:hypothetical protein